MPQSFAHLSDPHLSSLEGVSFTDLLGKRGLGYLSWKRKRRFEHRPEVLAALQRDLQTAQFDQLLVTGDLTHIGLPSEFQQAQNWLQQLGNAADIALVPGNHDACVATPHEETFDLWAGYMSSDEHTTGAKGFPTLRVRGDIAFIGVNTGVPKPPLMATGTAGSEQLQRLVPLLQQTREQGLFRVLHLHHCPLAGKEKWRKRLTDAPQLQQLLTDNGAELVVHGHGHRRHRFELDTRDGTAPVISVPSASALGLHGADVAEYNRYTVERADSGWRLQIDRRAYDSAHKAFEARGSEILSLQRNPN